ncbi:sulfoxide reductase catalytic subunit YedY precursor [Variibacter gotjawalensis]|uniref:Protein-methionine-sulfoxide reductase catalytic subunit MsrP n=1 Tax=Variibacter gotjawalensis TaxID=1333996 RepID=A0A0S3PQQ4_9BRAD|nr:protein-methionine-sulfoxide reductase catalytic subunit MsrP [Variibacter gotjawalensis]NIK48581.1 sulfoxide reductase catalytic subunit YedY [Variibacter gotjawalensis]RZS50446.1 sulfoxide reductase catalytic subunit YedY [Variibacter gotjawalensis]BAT58280.1 sulfoxide reductase catalytic subunit YedY precursor [Variibacter gotjawalensis]
MNIIRRRGWEIPEAQATPENLFLDRRALLGGGLGIAAAMAIPTRARAQRAADAADPSASLYPFKRNEKYQLGAGYDLTDEKLNANYNNFYEFGTSKTIAAPAQALKLRPWTVKIDGMVEKPMEIGFDDLLAKMPHEERLYRFRCVEAWSMTIPWSGFPLAELVKFAKPLGSATYLQMETFLDKAVAPGQRQSWYPWPYTEGLTMVEATNELAFIATGCYGHPLPKQHGAPLRLAVPWKYGFKSVKSITRLTFTDKRPKTYWEGLQASEYGFWANVNPEVSHPRWSQATEQVLGKSERIPTKLFNGYGEYVADLYKGLEKERLWA